MECGEIVNCIWEFSKQIRFLVLYNVRCSKFSGERVANTSESGRIAGGIIRLGESCSRRCIVNHASEIPVRSVEVEGIGLDLKVRSLTFESDSLAQRVGRLTKDRHEPAQAVAQLETSAATRDRELHLVVKAFCLLKEQVTSMEGRAIPAENGVCHVEDKADRPRHSVRTLVSKPTAEWTRVANIMDEQFVHVRWVSSSALSVGTGAIEEAVDRKWDRLLVVALACVYRNKLIVAPHFRQIEVCSPGLNEIAVHWHFPCSLYPFLITYFWTVGIFYGVSILLNLRLHDNVISCRSVVLGISNTVFCFQMCFTFVDRCFATLILVRWLWFGVLSA